MNQELVRVPRAGKNGLTHWSEVRESGKHEQPVDLRGCAVDGLKEE